MGRFRSVGLAVACAVVTAPAHADIYTWVDKAGVTNVSNIPPPQGVEVRHVARTAPKDPAREAALRDAAQLAEVRALRDQVDTLSKQVGDARGDAMPPPYAMAPVMAFAPPAPAPTVVVTVINQPAAQPEPATTACDVGFGCGLGFFPGYTYYAPPPRVGHRQGRGKSTPVRADPGFGANQIVPPLIPYPPRFTGGMRLG